MAILIYILSATFLVSLGGALGFFTLILKEKTLSRLLLFLVSLSTGALMGGAFIHLLPESAEKFADNNELLYPFILFSFIFFFLIEKLLYWRHCHRGGSCQIHTFGYMNLVGDAVHNFIDGLIIAGTFLTDVNLGISTTFAVALHEIPQEIGDFGVLLYAGFNKRKALLANLLVAFTAILGGISGYFLSFLREDFIKFLLPFAAGGFIYIAASDLMPEIRKEKSLKKSMVLFGIFVTGIFLMFALKMLTHE